MFRSDWQSGNMAAKLTLTCLIVRLEDTKLVYFYYSDECVYTQNRDPSSLGGFQHHAGTTRCDQSEECTGRAQRIGLCVHLAVRQVCVDCLQHAMRKYLVGI